MIKVGQHAQKGHRSGIFTIADQLDAVNAIVPARLSSAPSKAIMAPALERRLSASKGYQDTTADGVAESIMPPAIQNQTT